MAKGRKAKSTTQNKAGKGMMSWRRKTVWFFNRVLIAFTLLAYASAWVSPEFFWPAAFIAYTIPICFLGHLLFLYLWYKKQPIKMLYSALTLVIGYPFIASTLAINLSPSNSSDFTVLNYNAKVFNVYGNPDIDKSEEMIDWVLKNDADIKCLQEFYSIRQPGGKNRKRRRDVFDVLSKIKKSGYYCYNDRKVDSHTQTFGLAILSKYPIIKSERIQFQEASTNAAAFADIKLPNDKIIRVINVHLESVRMDEEVLTDTENIEENSKDIFRRLKTAFIKRSGQLKATLKCVEESPHPVILCGDLNDIPYSHTYIKLKHALESSFEKAGNGLGFSYNGLLFFLRIDNQFFSKGLEPTQYHTLRDIDFSDHYPIKAAYKFTE